MSNKELTDLWTSRIKSGKDYRKKFSSFDQWKKYREMYRGNWDQSLVPVNRIFSYGRSLIPRVYFRAPRVTVTATHPDLTWHAKVVEAIDNMLIRETFLKETIKQSTLDSFLCGVGPIKLGYDSEFGYIPEQAVLEDGETLTQESQKEGKGKIEYQVGVKPGMPWALRIRPEDLIVPWGSTDPNSLPWIAHYVLRPLEDVQEDQKYKNTKNLKGTRTPDVGDRPHHIPKDSSAEKDIMYAELYEIRDVKTRQIITICEDQILLRQDDALQIEGLPYEFVVFNPDPEHFWAIADCKILQPQQDELNEVRTQISRHRAILLIKFLYKKGAISETELNKFLSGMVGPAVMVEESVDILAQAIHEFKPEMPQILYNEVQQILQDMRESLGFTANQLGEFSPYHGKTATESMIVEQGFEHRVDERKDHVGDVLVRIVRKWNQYIFNFWDSQKVIEIASPKGEPFWVQYTGDELRGEYMLQVDVEAGMPITRALRYQMAKEMFGLFNGDPMIDQMALRQFLLGQYGQVDPAVEKMFVNPGALGPQMAAAARQPMPMMPGGGGGGQKSPSGRGTFERPASLETAKRDFGAMQ